MKYIKHSLLAFILVASSLYSYTYACGGYYNPNEEYYNLFDQLLLKEKGLRPYLLTMESGLYITGEEEMPDENLNAWMEFFRKNRLLPGVSEEKFNELLYKTPLNKLYNPTYTYTAMLNKSELGKEVLAYLQYAKQVEPYAQLSTDDNSWEVKRTASPSEYNYTIILNKGLDLYRGSKSEELKLRYGYQVVRLSHYMRNKNKEAIAIFNKYVMPLKRNHYIYYAALEQVAGALYNLGNLANANYLYCQVFDHSDNRKEIAYNSLLIQNQVDWDATFALCKNDRNRAAMYALRGYNTFSNEMEEVENIFRICPESPYIKLLAIRYINKMERSILSSTDYLGYESKDFLQPSEAILNEYNRVRPLIDEVMNHPQTTEKEFWKIYSAHMSFLCKDYQQAQAMLNSLKTTDPLLLKQASRTNFCLYLTQLTHIGQEEETRIAEYKTVNGSDNDFINEVMGHLYLQQGDLGKSFLTHNEISNLEYNPYLPIINSLIELHREEKSDDNLIPLYELKGTYYLRTGDYKEAANWYARVPADYRTMTTYYDYEKSDRVELTPFQFNGYSGISPLLFSNGFKRLFSVPAASQLTDKLYQQYDYLDKYHSKETLTQALLTLEKESEKNNEKGIRAAYLLANYYFNMSPRGYYRNIPMYCFSNDYISEFYAPYDKRNVYPDLDGVYNFKNFSWQSLVLNYMDKALLLYERVVAKSKDRELQARAQFMAAACHMDLYNQNWFYQKDRDKELNKETNEYFYKLATSYGDTQFYNEAIRECKYFEYYVRNEF